MLIHGMSWRLEQSNHGNFRDADGLSRKTEISGQKLLGTLFPKAPASASLSAMAPFSFSGNWVLLHGKKHCYHTSRVLHPDGWWIKLYFLQRKVKNYQGREICCLSRKTLSISRPVFCSLGKGGWSYRWTWTFSQNHLVWLWEEHFQKNGSKVYRERYSGQIK